MVAKRCKPEPGRPRNPELEQRILELAIHRLGEDGYSRMSVDELAAEAGVSKPTIYRRWASKADLATAAIRTLQISEPPVDTGSTAGDLTGVLTNFRRSLLRPNGMSLVGTVLAEEHHNPELLQYFRERIVAPRRQMLLEILERAQAQGELRPGADLEAAVTMLVGPFYAHYLASPKIPLDYPPRVVAIVWLAIAKGGNILAADEI